MANSKISALTAATTPLAGTEVLPIVQSSTTKQVSVANVTAGRSVSALSLGLNGITAPVTTLQIGVSGAGTGTQDAVLLTKYSSDTDQFRWLWNYSGTGYLGIGTSGTSMILGRATGTTGAVGQAYQTIDSSGNITANIGNFVQGTAAKGINFTANTPASGMTSQLLNWYEEGTCTLTLTTDATPPTTPPTATARYTRVGRLVTVQCNFGNKDTTGGTGNVLVTGFPFTAAATTQGAANFYNLGTTPAVIQINGSSTNANLVGITTQTAIAMSAGTGRYLYFNITYSV